MQLILFSTTIFILYKMDTTEVKAKLSIEGAPGSSVGRAPDSRSRGPGIETTTSSTSGYLVGESDSTSSALSEGRCAGGKPHYSQSGDPNSSEMVNNCSIKIKL